MVGVSIVTYIRALRKYFIAYASRGFIYDYSNIQEFTTAIKGYLLAKKNVLFFRMDPLIKIATYNTHLDKNECHNEKLVDSLINSGFKHYGFNIKTKESKCVSKLMEMYQELTSNEE